MACLLKVLMLLFLVSSPCLIGCSSQLSPEAAEKMEAQQDAGDSVDPADQVEEDNE